MSMIPPTPSTTILDTITKDVTTSIPPSPPTLVPRKTYTPAQVAQHRTDKDAWIIVHGKVYDMTHFQNEHPGGKKILQKFLGKDATKQFKKYHTQHILTLFEEELGVGDVVEEGEGRRRMSEVWGFWRGR